MAADAQKQDETVEVMKRRLRSALRQARETANLTQKEAADQQGWSVSKVVRIELGSVLPAPADVRALLSLYNVYDAASVTAYADLAKRAREGRGYSEYEDVYTPASIELFGNEPAARMIYKYEPNLIPGLFQTEDYARAVLFAFQNPEERVTRKLEVRVARQQLLENEPRPELNFIIGEAAVSTPAGNSAIMRKQLEYLRELAQRPGVVIRLLPFAAGVHRGLGEAFTILQFDETLSDLLYLEAAGRESVSRDDVKEIQNYLNRFAELQQVAASPEDTLFLIEKISDTRFKD